MNKSIPVAVCYWRKSPTPGWTMLAYSDQGDVIQIIAQRLHRKHGLAIHVHPLDNEQAILWRTEDAAHVLTSSEHKNARDIRIAITLLRAK